MFSVGEYVRFVYYKRTQFAAQLAEDIISRYNTIAQVMSIPRLGVYGIEFSDGLKLEVPEHSLRKLPPSGGYCEQFAPPSSPFSGDWEDFSTPPKTERGQ